MKLEIGAVAERFETPESEALEFKQRGLLGTGSG